jgi:hypothetical protein
MNEHRKELTDEELDICYESQFSGSVGSAVLKDLERECGWEEVKLEPDPRMQCFILGRRSIYKYILDRIKLKSTEVSMKPDTYLEETTKGE